MRSLHDVQKMNIDRSDPVCLSSRFNLRTAGPILLKFGTGDMLLEVTPKLALLNFLHPVIANMTDTQSLTAK
jgi:hypothetical protein